MLTLIQATDAHLPAIRAMAYHTWPDAFGAILSPAQIDYMLEMMYSLDALRVQTCEKNHLFLLASESDDGAYLGYVSYEFDYQNQSVTKIHKLYILPESQGKGVGYALCKAVADAACQHGNDCLSLNVNRYNKAVGFYERFGFVMVGAEDTDIGGGFVMQDAVMEKRLFS